MATGLSVLEVVDAVKQRLRRRFRGAPAPRAAPAIRPSSSRAVDRIRALGWKPHHDNLEEIVDQALRWERFWWNGKPHKGRSINPVLTLLMSLWQDELPRTMSDPMHQPIRAVRRLCGALFLV